MENELSEAKIPQRNQNNIWKPNQHSSAEQMRIYGDIIQEIDELLEPIGEQMIDNRKIRNNSRQASVAIRKLLLNERLLEKVVEKPRMHKLTFIQDSIPSVINGEIIFHRVDPAPHYTTKVKFRRELHSLPGWTLIQDTPGDYRINSDIFEDDEPKMNIDQWLGQPMISVTTEQGDKTFTLGDILKYVANKEGAHIDNKPSRIETAHFLEHIGGQDTFIYPHTVVTFAAIYIRNRQRKGLELHPEEWGKHIAGGLVPPLERMVVLHGETRGLSMAGITRTPNSDQESLVSLENDSFIIKSAVI